MQDLAEIRFYDTGWIIRVGLLALRYTKQGNETNDFAYYRALSLEILGRSFQYAGGMTWKQFKLSRKQAREASQTARDANRSLS